MDDAHFLHARQPLLANRVPAGLVGALINRDVLRQRLNRKMRTVKGDVFKERLAGIFGGVLFEILDRIIRHGDGVVITVANLDRRQLNVILVGANLGEIALLIHFQIGMVKAVIPGFPIHMPLARMIGAIAQRLQINGQQFRPARANATGAAPGVNAKGAGKIVPANGLGIIASEQT